MDQFDVATGTSHHLAISGIARHGARMAGLLHLQNAFPLPRKAAIAGLSMALLYGLLAMPSPPVWRSVFLCIAFALGPVFRRSTDALQLLALSIIAMLIFEPLDLYNAGFQLSFGTVLGLILFTRPVLDWLGSFRDPDLLLAADLNRPRGLRKFAVWPADQDR